MLSNTLCTFMPALNGRPFYKGLVMGAEFELEATNHYPSLETLAAKKINFTRHEDNSLRNRGVEFVTHNPTDPQQLIKDWVLLKEELKLTHTKIIEDSPRISTHLHINFQDRTLKEIINFVATCYILEDFIIYYAGDKRISNQFCLSVKDAEYQLENFNNLISQNIRGMGGENNYKYSNINLCSLPTKGTIEIRSLKGYPSVSQFANWVNIFKEIYETCCKPNYDMQQNLMQEISRESPFVWFKNTYPRFFKCIHAEGDGLTAEEINTGIFSNLRNIQYLLNRYQTYAEKEELELQKNKQNPSKKKSAFLEEHPNQEFRDRLVRPPEFAGDQIQRVRAQNWVLNEGVPLRPNR